MQTGRSIALQSAEQNAQRADDEYAHVSGYDVTEDDVEDDRDPKEIEAEKYGDRANNLGLFGVTPAAPAVGEEAAEDIATEDDVSDAFNEAIATVAEAAETE